VQKRIETPTPRPTVTSDDSRRRADDGTTLDVERLAGTLAAFGGTPAERRAVARSAQDLADDGRLTDDRETESVPSDDLVVRELRQAPDGGPAERWNWWIGSLEVAYGGYERFAVRRFRTGDARDTGSREGTGGGPNPE
jgi:hypothetical protein